MKMGSRERCRIGAATVVAVVAVALGAVGCGAGGQTATAKGGPASGRLTISAWPNYIDPGRAGAVHNFEVEKDIKVNYREDVSGDESFYKKMRPLLERGESGGSSILVVSDWMAKQLYEHGYLEEIDHADLPAVFESLEPRLRHPAFDPERRFSVPWQSDMTGLWLNSEKAHFNSVVEFFDPDNAGKVTMLAGVRESAPIVLLAESQEPVTASAKAWLWAIRRIRIGTQVHQIGALTGTGYTRGLNSGKLIAAIGRSADAPLIHNPKVKWLAPAQGCVLSSEDMVIPVGAPNTAAALAWMNYVYRPDIAAGITEYLARTPGVKGSVSPVKGVKEMLEKRGSKLARNPAFFPSREVTEKCTDEPSPPDPPAVNAAWRRALEASPSE